MHNMYMCMLLFVHVHKRHDNAFFTFKMVIQISRANIKREGNIYTGEVQQGERVQRFVPTNSPKGELLQQLADLP